MKFDDSSDSAIWLKHLKNSFYVKESHLSSDINTLSLSSYRDKRNLILMNNLFLTNVFFLEFPAICFQLTSSGTHLEVSDMRRGPQLAFSYLGNSLPIQ